MKKILALITLCFAVFYNTSIAFAQTTLQEGKEPDIDKIVDKQVKSMVRSLRLSESQEFYVDSIMRNNAFGLQDALDDLRKSGMQDASIYKQTSELWGNKTLDALKKVLDEQQYIRYLKSVGKGREYKKGKDGKFYLKSELSK